MQQVLHLKPLFQERIWGGNRLQSVFGYDIPSNHTGECWAISGRVGHSNVILNGPLKQKTLRDVYREYPVLFGNPKSDEFPLLTKIIDATDDLSVQVHPDDAYAHSHGIDSGKSECWLVLDAEKDAKIIYGHTAKTKAEMVARIQKNEWNELLCEKKVSKGDFFDVPAGVIHALGKGILILETQQSSDTTYRLFDYHRKDVNGKSRDLHLEEAIAVSMIPHQEQANQPKERVMGLDRFTTYVDNEYFTVEKWDIHHTYSKVMDTYLLVSVIEGECVIQGTTYKRGDHLVITTHEGILSLEGHCVLLTSKPK